MVDVKFPGYEYKKGVSTYKGYEVGEGGFVYSEPGVHHNVALLDVASMHPTSLKELNLFGKYTDRFADIMDARLAIKHGDLETAGQLLDGALKPYLENATEEDLDRLSYSLKIVINSVYGLTSAKFDNKLRDQRNVDNIVAKRGALFMVDLMQMVQEAGFNVAHIKTDSIKIPDADEDVIRKVFDMGTEYGYSFEHEDTYRTMVLVNKAVYVAEAHKFNRETKQLEPYWSATGAMFQHPYVFAHLFGDGGYTLEDLAEARSVAKGYIYLDSSAADHPPMLVGEEGSTLDLNAPSMHFVGKTGKFLPVVDRGSRMWRVHEGKHYAVADTSQWLWRDAHLVEDISDVDISYYEHLKQQALDAIDKVGSYDELIEHSTLPKPYYYRTKEQ